MEENNIVDALLGRAKLRQNGETREVVIKDGDDVKFTFKISGLNEDELNKCMKRNTRNRGRRNEEIDNARFMSDVIYTATSEDDKAIWRNKEVWAALKVASGVDVVNIVLTPSEKTAIFQEISKLGGFDDELDGIIKN